MYLNRDARFTACLAVVLGGMLLASVLDIWRQLLFALASGLALDCPIPFLVTGYVAHARYSY